MMHRREIDGLRALAVLPVILFHAGFSTFAGGFVGVDVFFVISGYLIAGIIRSELDAGKFSLAAFYERRARRLLPALFFLLAVCIPVAWFSLLPSEMESFAKSLASVTLFSSNILFWRQSGYFDTAAELKPLLHTWSLAVEEQYYCFFPVAMLLLWRRGQRWLNIGLLVGLFTSLAVAEWGARYNASAAFFLLPTRGWEMLLGAVAATWSQGGQRQRWSRQVREVGGWAGIALIGLSIFAFGRTTPFPGLYALVPTLGCALIILCASQETSAGAFLGHRWLVSIGLVSYSAYLWHQPIFAFARLRGLSHSNLVPFALLSLAALAIGYLSWRFIEAPFRNRDAFSPKTIAISAGIGSALFFSLGCYGVWKKGDVGQITPEQGAFLNHFENQVPAWNYFVREGIHEKNRADCDFYDLSAYRAGAATTRPVPSISKSCYSPRSPNSNLVFIWGDSHAAQLRSGLESVLPTQYELLQVASSGCVPSLGAEPSQTDFCEQSNWFAFEAINRLKPAIVIIAQRAGHDRKKMVSVEARLKEAGVERVLFVGPTPKWTIGLPNVLVRMLPDVPTRTLVGAEREDWDLDRQLILEANADRGFEYLSMIDYFCDASGCLTHLGSDVAATIISYDYGHLTPLASRQFAVDVLIPAIVGE